MFSVYSSKEMAVLQRALRVAAAMIAEHSQLYDEISNADAWYSELLSRAENDLAIEQASAGTFQNRLTPA